MRDLARSWIAAALFVTATLAGPARAQDAAAPRPPAAAGAGGATRSADAGATNPHGQGADPHGQGADPHADPHGQGADPHADPHGASPHGGRPKAGGGRTNENGIFEPPPDSADPDPSLPPGTILVHVLDADGAPVPDVSVTLGVLYNSVAKGESRKRLTGNVDGEGHAKFSSLDTGSGVAYRVTVVRDGASFALPPFQLPAQSGIAAVLHVYPVVTEPTGTLIVSQVMLYAEVKDDRVQVQQAVRIFNAGRAAWVPKDFVLRLPEDFTAFATQQQMSDIAAEAVPKVGVRFRGTFPPGQHLVEFRWQLPYSGEASVKISVGAPPRLFGARVISPASKDMVLEVPGFPAPEPTMGMGQRVLLTEKRFSPQEPSPEQLTVEIRGLPTAGPGKFIATGLAALGVVIGLVLGTAPRKDRGDPKVRRQTLLLELEQLERARASGDVGPKTYERVHRELMAALARTFEATAAARKRRAA